MSERAGGFAATALCVVCESYDGAPAARRLTGAREQMLGVAERLRDLGFAVRVVGADTDPDLAAFRREKEKWRTFWQREGRNGPALILWSGHGVLDGTDLRLVLGDLGLGGNPFERAMLLREHGVTAQQLVDTAMASGADQTLLFVDTCHAGAGLAPSVASALGHLRQTTLPEGRSKWLGVMASCRAGELSEGHGPLMEAVARTLAEGPRTDRYLTTWSNHNELVTGVDLLAAVRSRWEADGQTPEKVTVGDERPAFPNPKSDPAAPPALVEHLVLAARGAGHREEGWFFSGRRRVLGRIVRWMGTGAPGLFLVTGPAGCGKSAVLGRIATLADPRQRRDTERQGALREGDPDPGERDPRSFAAVHLRGLDAQRAAAELAARLGLAEPRSVDAFRAELREFPDPPVIVLDGLDEVPAEHTQGVIEELVFPLSRMLPVLVGSRERPFRSKLADGETLPQALVRYVGSVETADLEYEPDTRDDIAAYVRRRCEAAEVDGTAVARALAERATEADGGFLFARLVTGFLIARLREGVVSAADLLAGLPESVEAAFEEDLRSGPVRVRDDGTRLPSAARELLTALAWAAGRGMPAGGVWEAVASGLGTSVYDEKDVDWVLSAYGRYIVEDGAGPQAVYRLYHREFVSHLRGRDGDAGLTVLHTLTDLVRREGGPGDWSAIDPYVPVWLGQHAVWAGNRGIDALRGITEWDENALPILAGALHDLGALLSSQGAHRAALVAIDEATELFSRLAEDSDGMRAAFATSLASRSGLLARTGDHQAALGPLREAVRMRRELAQGDPDAHRCDLAASLSDLGTVLAQTGDHRTALSMARESVRIRRELAAADPAAHLSGLAMSLNNLANHLSENGDGKAALDTVVDAVRLHAHLARTDGTAHLPNLAGSLGNLATYLAENGDLRAALDPARKAVRILRELAAANPAAHLPSLAGSLNTLATRLAENGEHDAALGAAREAAELGRRLVAVNRSAHLPLHATCLDNLSVRLGENGDHRAALDTVREAVRIERELAAAHPAAHLPSLATSLNTLATRLARSGEARAALEAAEECVDIKRELVGTNRAAHLPSLAVALNNLASHSAQNGDRQAALEHTEECVDIRRELIETNRAAHLPGLAMALNNLANHLAHLGEHQAGLGAAREAVHIKRELTAANPAAHLPSLAGSLSTLATRLAENGEHEAAVSAAREAVGLYDGLSPTAQAVHLPERALAVNNLAGHLAETKDCDAALGTAREAVLLYSRLTLASPAAHRPGLANALTNLSNRLADTGDHRAALAPARQALRIRRELVAGNPAAHFADLLASLHALAGHLAHCGEEEQAVRLFTDATRSLVRDHPATGRAVACQRALFQLGRPHRAAQETGLRTLLGLLRDGATAHTAHTDKIDIRIRHRLRSLVRETPDHLVLFERVWRESTSGPFPDWLSLSDDVLDLVSGWLATPNWAESHAFWRRHADVLGSAEALTALTEYALADPGVREHIAMRERIRTTGATAVFLPLEREDRLMDWLDLGPGDDSRRFLHEHAGLLLDDAAQAALKEFGLPEYTALLHFARTDGIDAAYQRVQDPKALEGYVEQAVADGDAEALSHASAVELGFHRDELPALVHAQATALLSGDLEALAPGVVAGVAAGADPAVRNRLTSELAALSTRHGGRHMTHWMSLVQALHRAG